MSNILIEIILNNKTKTYKRDIYISQKFRIRGKYALIKKKKKGKLPEVFPEGEISVFQTNCMINIVHLTLMFGFFHMAIKKVI